MWCATASWVHLELAYEHERDGAKQNDGGEEVRRRRRGMGLEHANARGRRGARGRGSQRVQ